MVSFFLVQRGGCVAFVSTTRLDFHLNVGAENAVPAVDHEDQPARVDGEEEGDLNVAERRDVAEGVGEGGVLCKVGIEGILLLLRGALNQVPDDGPDFLYYKRLCQRCSWECRENG